MINNPVPHHPRDETALPAEAIPPAQSAHLPAGKGTRWLMLLLVGGAVIALDQTFKWLVVTRLMPGQSWKPIPAIAALIRITHSKNPGAAFGLLPQASDLFLALALITVAIFITNYPKLPSHASLSRMSIGLIVGGALSNALDRIRMGYVVDYVHVQLTPMQSNISNLADHAITVGVVLLLVDQWLAERREQSQHAMPAEQKPPDDSAALAAAEPTETKPLIEQ